MTGIERHWKEVEEEEREKRRALLAKLRAEHGWAIQMIGQLEAELEPRQSGALQALAQSGLGAQAAGMAGYNAEMANAFRSKGLII